MAKLKIDHAVYTSIADLSSDGNKGKDVTEKLQSMVDADTNTITFDEGVKFNDIFGDPEPFHPKILRVKFSVDGVDYKRSILEVTSVRRTISAADGAPVEAKPEIFDLSKEKGLQIENAVYGGISGSQKDVTEQIKEMVDPGTQRVTFPKTINFNSFFGGDPAKFATKQLKIAYKLDGKGPLEYIIPETRDKEYTLGPA